MQPKLALMPVFVFFVSFVVHLLAADWPQFRGPRGDGHATATNLPTTWDETTNVAWKRAVPGKGWASPCLVGGRIYLTTAAPAEGGSGASETALRTLCVDAVSGRIVWNVQ